MPDTTKLLRDIHTLRESIQIDWEELYSNPLRDEERREIRKHLELCQAELKSLIEQLVGLEEDKSKVGRRAITPPNANAARLLIQGRTASMLLDWVLASRHPHPASSHHLVMTSVSKGLMAGVLARNGN